MSNEIIEFLNLSPSFAEKLMLTFSSVLLLILFRIFTALVVNRKIEDNKRRYHIRKTITYGYTIILIAILGSIWFQGMASLGTFLGLTGAGLAVALHDTIANMAGFFFIETRKPFRVGDRIEIGDVRGDVVDIRLFQFSLVEVGNWVDADQSTGRIIHIPNSLTLKTPLCNYHIGFEYIWNEIPVLITFESDWKRAKELLLRIGKENAENLSLGAQEQIRAAAKKYLIVAGKLTPTVYTSVKDSGVMLTIRYLVDPRQRRSSEQGVWEEILEAFAKEENVELAYSTTRFYMKSDSAFSGSGV
ncbi:MAG TPA: mechanosensitive ion channel domain-containing protein [Pontiella sp.]